MLRVSKTVSTEKSTVWSHDHLLRLFCETFCVFCGENTQLYSSYPSLLIA